MNGRNLRVDEGSDLKPLTVGERAVLTGGKILGALAFPGMALGQVIARHPDRQTAYGLIISVLGWPVTIPTALVLGPVSNLYDDHFRCAELSHRG